MSAAVLVVHSWMRWVVLLLGLVAVVRAIAGRVSGRPWHAGDAAPGLWYSRALDVQVLIGLVLYFVFSHLLNIAQQDFGRAMATPAVRFWLVEHLAGMLVALALGHAGTSRVRNATTDAARFGRAACFYGLSALAVVLSSPWPGLAHARPLLRWF